MLLPCIRKVALERPADKNKNEEAGQKALKARADQMGMNEQFAAIRKGLLEFLILRIVSADKVYVADMLKRLDATEFATQEGTLYPLLSKMRRDGLVDYEWQESEAGPPRKYYKLTAKGKSQLSELNDYWAQINFTISGMGN